MDYVKIQIEELEEFKLALEGRISALRIFMEANKDMYTSTDDEKRWLDPERNGLDDIGADAIAIIDKQISALRGE